MLEVEAIYGVHVEYGRHPCTVANIVIHSEGEYYNDWIMEPVILICTRHLHMYDTWQSMTLHFIPHVQVWKYLTLTCKPSECS